MGGFWYLDRKPRIVQCPACQRVFHSGKSNCQCSKCGIRFDGDNNLFKTQDDRSEERKVISDLLIQLKKKHDVMISEFNEKYAENNEIIKKIENLLKPL